MKSPYDLSRLLASFILIVCITMTSSKTRDITELRNKVSKNKVNSRGNLWATGHFMGKKSVVDRSFMESTSEGTLTEVRSGGHRQEDLQAALIQVLQVKLTLTMCVIVMKVLRICD
uniref:Neuromedin Bb n=1 Tax=Monopterus albus TaxID=43700 RepID=A0A3Q3JHI2_MONAL